MTALSTVNQEALRSLIRTIELSQGQFALILARCNFHRLRDRMQAELRDQLQVPFQEVHLQPHTQSMYTAIRQTVGEAVPTAVLVNGLETVTDLDTILQVANQSREEFRNHLPCPVVIWVTDEILNRLIRDATDFESWASITLEFTAELAELTEFVMQTADNLFQQLLDSREHIFLDNQSLHLNDASPLRTELRAACETLRHHRDPLPPEVEASGEFILGRVADNNTDVAREHYERSLALWKQVGDREHQGHVQFYLGFWWRIYAVRHPHERTMGLQKARDNYEQAMQTFDAIGQHHRIAQFINFLGEVMHRQEDWSALDDLACEAFTLHQRYRDYFRQARALGFMATVASARTNWSQAEYRAKQALAIWQQGVELLKPQGDRPLLLDWEQRFHRPWYLFFLGQAQRQNQQLASASQTLEEARKAAKPSYDPDLYINILNELREIYFAQRRYLKAYKTRQFRREIQGKFNFRPFVGPGRLQAGQDVTNPSLPQLQPRERIAPELETSTRQQDIEALIHRVERQDFRLSVVYGPSGVGKSSVLQAGLVPMLKQRTFDGRAVVVVLQQVYQNWAQELSQQMTKAGRDTTADGLIESPLKTLEDVLDQLRKNSQQKFKTILIFDQFEEFFFANATVEEHYRFYNFAVACFHILDVDVILSIKEDFIHYLLACNRLSGLEIINNNILDKKILYYIGNFSRQEAYRIVKNRTQNTRLTFDDDLIEQIVDDLVDSFDQVRPIELQIVGAQLQTDGITTLAAYQALASGVSNPRQILVNRYLESVVDDCGSENQELAEIILYLLTSEDGTRPIRTKSEIAHEKLCESMQTQPDQIDVILNIFVQAGLVLLVPSSPVDSYQLVHDYLVNLIREKVQTKYQERIALLQERVAGLDRIIRLLAVLLLSLVSIGSVLYLLYRNNKLLYEVTQLERNSIENLSKFNGYQLSSLQDAVRDADTFTDRPAIGQRTTLPIHTLQYVLDNIAERRWLDTQQVQIFAADVHGPTGQVATAGLDQTVKLWDFDGTRQQQLDLAEPLGESGQIWDVRFTAAGDRLAVIDSAGQLSLWALDAEPGTAATPVATVAAHESDRFLTRLITTPDRSTLATAGVDGAIRLWRADDLSPQAEWSAHAAPISGLAFSPDGQTLVSADYEGHIHIWAIAPGRPGELVRKFSIAGDGSALSTFALAISPDGQLLMAASNDGFVRMWDLATGILRQEFLAHNGQWVTALDVMPNPDPGTTTPSAFYMVTADEQGNLRSWQVNAQESVQLRELKGHQGWVWNLLHTTELAAPLEPHLISTGIDGSLRFWHLGNTVADNASYVNVWRGHQAAETRQGQAWSTSYSGDRNLLATSGADGTAKVWDLTDMAAAPYQHTPRHTLKHEQSPVSDCQSLSPDRGEQNQDVFWAAFSPDGGTIATAGADCTVRLWDSQSGKPVMQSDATGAAVPVVMAHRNDAFVYTVAFSPNGRLIASADSQGRLFVWTAAGEPLHPDQPFIQVSEAEQKQPVFAVQFSPEGEYVATASEDGDVKLWSLANIGRSLPTTPAAVLKGHRNGATSVDFSGDGLIATAAKDGTVRIWDLEAALTEIEAEPIQHLSAYNRRVTWVEFYRTDDAPAEMLATASKDGSVIVWERSLQGWGLEKPGQVFKRRYQFTGHEDGAFSSTFLANGRQLAVAQGDGQIKFWHLEDTPELIRRACDWMGRPAAASHVRDRQTRLFSWVPANDPDIASICRKY